MLPPLQEGTIMTQSQKMNAALEQAVIAKLKADGFEGKFPHYRRVFPDRIELISFPKYKYGNAFYVQASVAFPNREKHEQNIDHLFFSGNLETLIADDCKKQYRLKSRFGECFYYTDVFIVQLFGGIMYQGVSEKNMKSFRPKRFDIHVQKYDESIYLRICDEINHKMPKIYKWWSKMAK